MTDCGPTLDALKRRLTGHDRWGRGRDFAEFRPLALYDREQAGWPMPRGEIPLTLLTGHQLDLVHRLLVGLDARGVSGDCLEAGVWRGGTVILMRAVLDSHGMAARQVIAADSFAGIPPSTRFRHDPVDRWTDRWIASREEVASHLADFGMNDGRVEMLEGVFARSLARLAGRQLAFVRLDCDSHDSVMDALVWLYPLLMPGGVILIDDWHLIGCRIAVDAYRKRHGIADPLQEEAENGYWIKSQAYGEPVAA